MKRLQNYIAESRRLLPISIAIATLVCLAGGLLWEHWWTSYICLIVTTMIIAQLNTDNALTRIYSRTISVSWLLLTVMAIPLLPSLQGGIVSLCFALFLLFAFRAYQRPDNTPTVFYAYMAWSIATVLRPGLVTFVPLFWILLATHLQAFSGKTFVASILGLLLPWWFVGAWDVVSEYVFNEQLPIFDFQRWTSELIMSYNHSLLFTIIQWVNAGAITFDLQQLSIFNFQFSFFYVQYFFVFILFITGSIHFFRQRIHDKIQVRKLYHFFFVTGIFVLLLSILFPLELPTLFRLLVVCTSPLIGHFFALTQTRTTNITFIVCLLIMIALTALSLWPNSLIF